MDANNIKYIVAIAKYGSINHAAKAMFISQPQLSHILKITEEECGLTLFQRTSRGTRLTPEGEDYLHHCEIILAEMAKLNHYVTQAASAQSRLKVSMTRFSHISECFNEVCRRHQADSSIHYHLYEASASNVLNDVVEGKSDIGILHFSTTNQEMTLQGFADKKLSFTPLATFRPYVCLAENHPVLQGKVPAAIDIRELKDYGFVRYAGQYEDFIYHIASDSGLIDLNESQKIIYVCDRQEQMRLIQTTTFYTIGIAAFSDQSKLYQVISVPILKSSEHLAFGIITRKDTVLSPLEQEFKEEVIRKYRTLAETEG